MLEYIVKYIWLHVVICGYTWLFMVICGYTWLFMVICGNIYDYIRYITMAYMVIYIYD
jgi:hypothetical protein